MNKQVFNKIKAEVVIGQSRFLQTLSILMLVSLLTACTAKRIFPGGSSFANGFARIQQPVKDSSGAYFKSFYINEKGKKAFDAILEEGFGFRSRFYGERLDSIIEKVPTLKIIVRKNTHYGALTIHGNWLLKPIYDTIITGKIPYTWLVFKNGKKSFYTKDGLMLPFNYEDVRMLSPNFYKVKLEGKWGIYNHKTGGLAVPTTYQQIENCYSGRYLGEHLLVKKNNHWGVIDFKNQIIIPCVYDKVQKRPGTANCVWRLRRVENLQRQDTLIYLQKQAPPEAYHLKNGYTTVLKNEKYGMLNPQGEVVLPVVYDYISVPSNSFLPTAYLSIKKGNHYGVIDRKGKIVLPPKYESVDWLADVNGEAVYRVEKNYKAFLLNADWEKILPGKYESIYTKHWEVGKDTTLFFQLNQNGKYGLYYPKTKTLVPPKYDYLSNSKYQVSLPYTVKVRVNDKQSFLDARSGKLLVPLEFAEVLQAYSPYTPAHLKVVEKKGKYGIYDTRKQKLVVPLTYTEIGDYQHLFHIYTNQGEGLMNFDTEVILAPEYAVHPVDDVFYLLEKEGEQYLFNRKTRKRIQLPKETQQLLLDSLLLTHQNGTYQLYNPWTQQPLKTAYAKGSFPDSLVLVNRKYLAIYKNNKVGLINLNGEYVLPLQYDGISEFKDGLAVFQKGKDASGRPLYGFMNAKGEVIVPAKYVVDRNKPDRHYFYKSYLLLLVPAQTDTTLLMGLADRKGNLVIPPKYNRIIPVNEAAYFIVQKGDKFGMLNKEGKVILSVKFDDITLEYRPYKASKIAEKELLYNHNSISFPVLTKQGSTWQYYGEYGNPLPVKVKAVVNMY